MAAATLCGLTKHRINYPKRPPIVIVRLAGSYMGLGGIAPKGSRLQITDCNVFKKQLAHLGLVDVNECDHGLIESKASLLFSWLKLEQKSRGRDSYQSQIPILNSDKIKENIFSDLQLFF